MSAQLLLAQRLKAARLSKGYSQTELARRMNVAHSTISGAESGKQELSAVKLIRWANACQVSLLALCGGIE